MEEEVIYVNEQNQRIQPPSGAGTQTSTNYPPVQASRSDKGDILDKINPDLIVEVIRHKLLGEEFINGKWVKIESLQHRGLTDVGAWEIANLMLGASSQNVALSSLKDDEIRPRALAIARTAQKNCLKNWKEYGIKGTDQLAYVHEIVFTNTFITLKQPQNGGIRDLIKGTTQESRMVSSNEEQKRGFFRRR